MRAGSAAVRGRGEAAIAGVMSEAAIARGKAKGDHLRRAAARASNGRPFLQGDVGEQDSGENPEISSILFRLGIAAAPADPSLDNVMGVADDNQVHTRSSLVSAIYGAWLVGDAPHTAREIPGTGNEDDDIAAGSWVKPFDSEYAFANSLSIESEDVRAIITLVF